MEQFQDNTETQTPKTPAPENKRQEGLFGEVFRFALLALLIVLPIRVFVAQPFIVSGASMEETFHSGEYLIVDQLSYRFNEPERGDVVIFKYPKDPSKYFIKRVIGVPGDTVRISGTAVTITNDEHPRGFTLDEPYVDSMRENALSVTTLNTDEYFVMGDNRDASSDSRIWGVLPRENIIGRAYVRLSPLSKIELLPGSREVEEESN
jgi:signal peptidase I